MKYIWISWYHKKEMGSFELHYPWWVTGEREDGERTICAAIPGESTDFACESVLAAYDKTPTEIEWRFQSVKEGDLFNSRFQKAEWMLWPDEERKKEKRDDE